MRPFNITYRASPVRRPAIFAHIQKTAGTTIIEAVRRHYRNRFIAHGDYLEHDTASLKNIPFISGHFGFEFCRQFMDGRYSFTFLRDPVERLLSLYFFSRTRDPAEFPIYRAAHERAKAIGDFTAAQILERAKTHLMEFNYIGLAETFAIDSRAILADLNVPSPEYLVPTNVTPRRPHRNDLPAATLRLAQELTSLDAALYEHAKDVRNRG